MANQWQNLWQNKNLQGDKPTLGKLIAMVGWKTDDGDLPEAAWLEFIDGIVKKLPINPGDQILEVGCGPGGFLLPFYENGYSVSGLDYSESLIDICNQVMPNGDFHAGEAKALPFQDSQFDVLTCNSVCHYFLNYDYAEQVLAEMARVLKIGGVGTILDANDLTKQDAFMQHRYERFGGKEEYDKQNSELPQMFYAKEWFIETGKKYGLDGYVEDQNIEWYRNSQYRFNYFFKKISS